MYFVDFDRTLFDYERFIAHVSSLPGGHTVAELPKEQRTAELERLLSEGVIAFAPGELYPFLFPDAADFLRAKENSAMIITFGNPDLQKAKVKSATHGIARVQTIYTGMVRKGEFLAPNIALYGPAPIYVDDLALELELMQEHCPNVRPFEIRRDGMEGDGRWPVVRTLSELP